MRFAVYVLGCEVFAVEFGDAWEVEEAVEGAEGDVEGPARYDGSSANGAHLERDTSPLSPDDRYGWEWEDKGRGFGFTQ